MGETTSRGESGTDGDDESVIEGAATPASSETVVEAVKEVLAAVSDPIGAATSLMASAIAGGPGWEPQLPPSAFDTTGPRLTASGLVKCDQCGCEVPYSSMSIFVFGYLCARCAARNG